MRKIKNFETKPATRILGSNKSFWADVRNEWESIIKRNEPITLKSSYNDEKLFSIMFSYASELTNGKKYSSSESKSL